MPTAQAHYDQLLGSVYTWMAGGFEAAAERNRQQLAAFGLASWPRGLAVDLGCGSGFQSVPLAEAGYRVLGLDLCEPLLTELRARAGDLPIRAVCDDLTNLAWHLDVAPTLIVCMGDTLTHLPSLESVSAVVSDAARVLAPGGRLVLGFRDLATHELKGTQRFIPVRHEAERLFTCFLDYQPGYVEVNDLLHERTNGQWKFSASSYRKLRLTAAQVAGLLTTAGLTIEHASTEQGLVRLIAVKKI
jgi:SAM-dependent methyltransferase